MQKKLKQKKCRVCGDRFTPRTSLQVVCERYECRCSYSDRLIKKMREKRIKESKKETRAMRERIKTHSDHLRELQIIFNQFIRLRDEYKGCISCGISLRGRKFDAGHFYCTGARPELRFDENNCHGQCVPCNRYKHGNLIEYEKRLPERIGRQAYDYLKSMTSTMPGSNKMTIDQIVARKEYYKKLIKEIKKTR